MAPALTGRQLEVLELLSEGSTDQEMAEILGVTITTVRTHIEAARWALHARNRVHVAVLAVRAGLL